MEQIMEVLRKGLKGNVVTITYKGDVRSIHPVELKDTLVIARCEFRNGEWRRFSYDEISEAALTGETFDVEKAKAN